MEEGEGKCRRGDGTKLNWKKSRGGGREDNAELEDGEGKCRRGVGTKLDLRRGRGV